MAAAVTPVVLEEMGAAVLPVAFVAAVADLQEAAQSEAPVGAPQAAAARAAAPKAKAVRLAAMVAWRMRWLIRRLRWRLNGWLTGRLVRRRCLRQCGLQRHEQHFWLHQLVASAYPSSANLQNLHTHTRSAG